LDLLDLGILGLLDLDVSGLLDLGDCGISDLDHHPSPSPPLSFHHHPTPLHHAQPTQLPRHKLQNCEQRSCRGTADCDMR
jgi:hypothetical protein